MSGSLSDSEMRNEELCTLADGLCNGQLTSEQRDRLEMLIVQDDVAAAFCAAYANVHAMLRWRFRPIEPDAASSSGTLSPDASEPESVSGETDLRPHHGHTAPLLFGNVVHGAIGFFSQEVPFAILLASVITGLGLWLGSLVYVTHHEQFVGPATRPAVSPSQVIDRPTAECVARITGMMDVKWGEGSKFKEDLGISASQPRVPHSTRSRISMGDRFVLSSGLLELTYDGGAKVILQGPVTYEVDSRESGYLSVGKLRARLEEKRSAVSGQRSEKVAGGQWLVASESDPKSQNHEIPKSQISSPQSLNADALLASSPRFTIKTPTAIVTDLGTEFGVEVDRAGVCDVQVIEGHVKAESVGQHDAPGDGLVLSARQAVRFTPGKRGYTVIAAVPEKFNAMQIDMVRRPKLEWPILDKTLVAWVRLAKAKQKNAGVFSIENYSVFDAITLGGITPGKWMAGSNEYLRTERDQSHYSMETAGPDELIQIAISYTWEATTIYRNGRKYAEYRPESRLAFKKDSVLLIGRQYLAYLPPSATLAGEVEEARLYNVALSPQMIALLKPNEPSSIRPVGQWTFEDGTARDVTGHFPMGLMQGKAYIVNGRLVLDGENSCVVIPAIGGLERPTEVVNSDFERDISPWYGWKPSADGTDALAPEMVSRLTGDTPDGLQGALRVSIVCDPHRTYLSHCTGAVCPFRENAPAGSTLRISFYAKSISGARWLNVFRLAGGADPVQVQLEPTWRHYQVDMPLGWITPATSVVVFNSVSQPGCTVLPLADGVFLLDQVRVTAIPLAHVNANDADHAVARPGSETHKEGKQPQK